MGEEPGSYNIPEGAGKRFSPCLSGAALRLEILTAMAFCKTLISRYIRPLYREVLFLLDIRLQGRDLRRNPRPCSTLADICGLL